MSEQYVLETRNLVKEFKGFVAVNDVNLQIRQGDIHALIGPNGAGKTTVFNLITGLLRASSGSIRFNDDDIGAKVGQQHSAKRRRADARNFEYFEACKRTSFRHSGIPASETLAL